MTTPSDKETTVQIRTGTQDPIAYTYEADTHCPDCAAARFGVDESGFIPETATDGEGNPIGALFPWDEWIELSEIGVQVLACGTCAREIDRFEDVDAIERAADAAGYEAGKAAGGWMIDGNTTEETARAIIRGIEDGDPAVLDQLPTAPLSGEWADGLLPRDLLRDYGMDEDHPAADDVLRAYEDGYDRGAVEEVSRAAWAMLPSPDVEEVLTAYVACALWSSIGEDGEPLDDVYSAENLAEETRAAMRAEVSDFLGLIVREGLDVSAIESAQIGHDFWLTRNGHGAGFWGRGLGDLGDKLTTCAKSYGSSDLYVGTGGLLYVT